jgi:hypothetical protein
MRNFVRVVLTVGMLSACRGGDRPSHPSPTLVTRALDSCAGRSRTVAPGTSFGPTTWAGKVFTFQRFSLFIPDSARVTSADTVLGGLHLAWPGCAGCRFGLRIGPDSGIALETRVARMVESQRKIDSINHDPKTVVQEFDEIDGPPLAFMTATGRGYVIDNDCGDCAATTVLFGRPGYIAEVNFGGDDDVPNLGRHVCEMTVVAKTFTWRQ